MTVVLLNGVYRPEVDMLGMIYGSPLIIDQTASDPVPTCTFTLDDTGSQLTVGRLQEVVVIDNDAFASPTQNLIVSPTVSNGSFYGSNSEGGGTGSMNTNSNAITVTSGPNGGIAGGIYGGAQFSSTLAPIIRCTPGQAYMLSATMSVTTPLVNSQAVLRLEFRDASNTTIATFTSTPLTVGTGVRMSVQGTAPAGAVSFISNFALQIIATAASSGVAAFTNLQLEPVWFAVPTLTMSYPTPFCDVSQPNCIVLPNGTTIRQKRLFAGFVTGWINGPYAGRNRPIQVSASGPAFLIDGRLVSKSYSSQYDDQIIANIVSTYFSGIFTTNHVQRGVLYSSVAYNYDSARTVFDALASTSTNRWFVDPYYDIWYIPPGFYMSPYGLSDTPDNTSTFVYSEYSSEYDFTQPANNAYVTVSGGPNFVRTADVQAVANVGFIFDRKISDSSITTNANANQRGLAEVLGYAYERGILHLQVDQRIAQPSLVPGTAIAVTNSIEGFSNVSYLIQKVHIVVAGIDKSNQARYLYQMDLGAYQPLLSNILARSARAASQSSSTALTMVEDHVDIIEYVGYQDSINIH